MEVLVVNDLLIPVDQILSIREKSEGGVKMYTLMMPYGEVELTPEQTADFEKAGVITATYNLNQGSGNYEHVLAKIVKNVEEKLVKPGIEEVGLGAVLKSGNKG